MSARMLYLARIAPSCDAWRGWRARDLLTEVCGRAPMWSAQLGAWTAGPWRTADAVALWESRGGWIQEVSEHDLLAKAAADRAERRGELW